MNKEILRYLLIIKFLVKGYAYIGDTQWIYNYVFFHGYSKFINTLNAYQFRFKTLKQLLLSRTRDFQHDAVGRFYLNN